MAKTILITGASTGIGAETARFLAEWNLILVHYNASKSAAEKVAGDVVRLGGEARLFQADLTSEDGCIELFTAVSDVTDKLDVLVNNAGGLIRRQPLHELEWRLMEKIFSLNTFSTMKMTSLCVPLLEKGEDPCVINITSIAMRNGAPTATVYGAAKSAIDSFTRGAASELAPRIRVNAVAPGVIKTPFHERYSSEERMKAFAENSVLKRNGEAHHIAMAIKLIVENDFITGETLDINGGLFMR
jgi:3-oxoacyl-[acyl-carrier protein] reductase